MLVISWLWLRQHHSALHWLGATICFAGIGLLVATDKAFTAETKAPAPLFGDSLVLFGAFLYAVCNVAQERLLGELLRTAS